MPAVISNPEGKIQTARALCEQGRWRNVLTFAQKWHETDPDDYHALYYVGLGLSGTNHYADAEAAYRLALTMEPADFKVWNNLGGLLFEKLRRESEGIGCLEEALKIDPDNKLGWSNLASMVGRLGRHEQVLECAGRALALDPKLVEAQLHKGKAARALGRQEIVREVCAALAAIEPEKFCRTR